jgi:hypothetical protein
MPKIQTPTTDSLLGQKASESNESYQWAIHQMCVTHNNWMELILVGSF